MKKYLAEAIGTAVLVAFGCGAALVHGMPDGPSGTGILGIALAFGLCIVAMAYSIGNISGCHINPAVSFAMLLRKKMTVNEFLGYITAQVLGAVIGAAVLYAIVGSATFMAGGGGCNGFGELSAAKLSAGQAFLAETALTFVFLMSIIGVTSKPEYASVAGLVIGLSLALVHIFGIPLTGTSVNPARSIGPALFMGGEYIKQLWLFIAAPLAGSALAVLAYSAIEDKAE